MTYYRVEFVDYSTESIDSPPTLEWESFDTIEETVSHINETYIDEDKRYVTIKTYYIAPNTPPPVIAKEVSEARAVDFIKQHSTPEAVLND